MKNHRHTSKLLPKKLGTHPRRKRAGRRGVQEESFGVVPVYKKNSDYLYLVLLHRGGHWAFPKGHREKGEAPIETARREFTEETGIRGITIYPEVTFKEEYRYTFRGELRLKTVVYFLGITRTKEVRIEEEEISDYRWATFAEAEKLLSFIEGREMLRGARKYLSQNSNGGK